MICNALDSLVVGLEFVGVGNDGHAAVLGVRTLGDSSVLERRVV